MSQRPSPARLALATLRSAIAHFLGYTSLFWIFGAIALDRTIKIGPLEPFKIGMTEIPKWDGAGFNNLTVFICCAAGIVALAIAFVVRYFQHREKLRSLRSRGITDLDGDGRPDVFTDRFLDDL